MKHKIFEGPQRNTQAGSLPEEKCDEIQIDGLSVRWSGLHVDPGNQCTTGRGVDRGRAGPNGVVVRPRNILWAGDGNSLLQAVDLNVNHPRITHTISLGNPVADGRADELAYDPFERIVLVGNDVSHPPKLTFVSADTYSILSKIDFPDATGMEQPIWDTQLHRFLV